MFLVYVKSNTLLGDSKHATGVVLAEIVKANIPVRNGVVHLIHRPLMIIDTTVTQFLQVSQQYSNTLTKILHPTVTTTTEKRIKPKRFSVASSSSYTKELRNIYSMHMHNIHSMFVCNRHLSNP